jgi:hypothetical protein
VRGDALACRGHPYMFFIRLKTGNSNIYFHSCSKIKKSIYRAMNSNLLKTKKNVLKNDVGGNFFEFFCPLFGQLKKANRCSKKYQFKLFECI